MKHILVTAWLLFSASWAPAQNQPAFELNGKPYHYNAQNQLTVTEPGTGETFPVDTRVITVKAAPVWAGSAALNDFLQANDLQLLRTAITGFSDLAVPEGGDYVQLLEWMQDSGLFEVVEANTIGRYLLVPNDTDYGLQWHLPNVGAEAAWDIQNANPAVVVAVLDSGTEFTHSDLGDGSDGYHNIWLNPGEDAWSDPEDPNTGNGVDDDGNGFVDDWKGWDFDNNDNDGSGSFYHGTAVAGVISAKTNNNLGVAGVAGGNLSKGTSIMIGNVGNNAPNASVLDDAILYAAANGARIVQLSLSVGSSAAIDAAISEAYVNQGVLIISASGNSGNPANNVSYPSTNPLAMAVGATTPSNARASFSNYGPEVEVAAPGVDINTTSLNNGYTETDGTSFSAPLTSGIASLIMARHPSLTNEQVRQILKDSADKTGGYDYNHDVNNPGHSLELGYGRVNLLAALLLSDSVAGPGFPIIFKNGFEGDVIFAHGFD